MHYVELGPDYFIEEFLAFYMTHFFGGLKVYFLFLIGCHLNFLTHTDNK